MELAGYLASIFMGVTIGLLGGGGSILTVPILVYLFSVPPIEATTSSLFIVGSTALVTSGQYAVKRQLDVKTALIFSLPSLVGIFVSRNLVLPAIPNQIVGPLGVVIEKGALVLSAFAVLMIVAALSMIKKKTQSTTTGNRSVVAIGAYGTAVGFITGFVGAGGGFLIIPVLVNFLKLPMRIAVGTSLIIIALNSLFGFSVSFLVQASSVNWPLQLTVLGLALVGSVIGTRFAGRIDERKLKIAFGWFVLLAGSAILLERLS